MDWLTSLKNVSKCLLSHLTLGRKGFQQAIQRYIWVRVSPKVYRLLVWSFKALFPQLPCLFVISPPSFKMCCAVLCAVGSGGKSGVCRPEVQTLWVLSPPFHPSEEIPDLSGQKKREVAPAEWERSNTAPARGFSNSMGLSSPAKGM